MTEIEKHGDHSCQHVAYDCHNLEKFISHMKSLGGHPRGNVLVQDDGFGILKQMFAKGYASGHAGEATFPEYCERPETADAAKEVEITFSKKAGGEFYKQVQNAIILHKHVAARMSAMSYLKKIDHVSYAVEKGNIEKWAWFHIEVEGGTLIKRIDDARPGDPNSSMKIWCIDYGDFGIALIEGIVDNATVDQ